MATVQDKAIKEIVRAEKNKAHCLTFILQKKVPCPIPVHPVLDANLELFLFRQEHVPLSFRSGTHGHRPGGLPLADDSVGLARLTSLQEVPGSTAGHRGCPEVQEGDVDTLALAGLDQPRTLDGTEFRLLCKDVRDVPRGSCQSQSTARQRAQELTSGDDFVTKREHQISINWLMKFRNVARKLGFRFRSLQGM